MPVLCSVTMVFSSVLGCHGAPSDTLQLCPFYCICLLSSLPIYLFIRAILGHASYIHRGAVVIFTGVQTNVSRDSTLGNHVCGKALDA